MARRSGIPWTEVQVDYTLGALSLSEICAKYGIADSNLRARAKRENWPRGDGSIIREATRVALATVSAERARQIGADIGAEQAQRYEACLEEVAMSTSEIKMQHRLATRRGMNVAMDLLREIEVAALAKSQIEEELARCQIDDPARAALIDKLLGLRGRVDTMDKWATAMSKIADAERRANDMDADNKASEVDALLLRIHADKQAHGHGQTPRGTGPDLRSEELRRLRSSESAPDSLSSLEA